MKLQQQSTLNSNNTNDVQIETNKRIEGKVDLLLENFNLEYKE